MERGGRDVEKRGDGMHADGNVDWIMWDQPRRTGVWLLLHGMAFRLRFIRLDLDYWSGIPLYRYQDHEMLGSRRKGEWKNNEAEK